MAMGTDKKLRLMQLLYDLDLAVNPIVGHMTAVVNLAVE
jgi:hypothetical protein